MKVYNTKKIENFESSINSIANNLEIALDYNPLSKNCYRIKLKKGSRRPAESRVIGNVFIKLFACPRNSFELFGFFFRNKYNESPANPNVAIFKYLLFLTICNIFTSFPS